MNKNNFNPIPPAQTMSLNGCSRRRRHHSCENYKTLGNRNRRVSWRLLVQFLQAEQ